MFFKWKNQFFNFIFDVFLVFITISQLFDEKISFSRHFWRFHLFFTIFRIFWWKNWLFPPFFDDLYQCFSSYFEFFDEKRHFPAIFRWFHLFFSAYFKFFDEKKAFSRHFSMISSVFFIASRLFDEKKDFFVTFLLKPEYLQKEGFSDKPVKISSVTFPEWVPPKLKMSNHFFSSKYCKGCFKNWMVLMNEVYAKIHKGCFK